MKKLKEGCNHLRTISSHSWGLRKAAEDRNMEKEKLKKYRCQLKAFLEKVNL